MSLFRIAWANLRIRPMSTFLSVVLLAFGVGIISLLVQTEKQLTEQFNRNIRDIDMVLGYKGSPMQLILANVYHVDAPTGNIKVRDARKVITSPMVKKAIPLAYGDNYQKFRIVGTSPDYPDHYRVELLEGRAFSAPFEAVIGSRVAEETGLRPGDTFESTHGLDQEAGEGGEDHHHHTPYTVVGIYAESGSAIDQLILTPVESVWLIHDHGEPADSALADADREMTAYLLIKRSPMAQIMLPNLIRDTDLQLAVPAIEVNRLSQNFGLGMETLRAIALLIMALSFVSVFASLLNSLKERRYELALMRTMGGGRATLLTLILLEGFMLSALGSALGLALGRAGLFWLSGAMDQSFHYRLDAFGMLPSEWILLAVTAGVGTLASFLPAWLAYRMDISKTLSNG